METIVNEVVNKSHKNECRLKSRTFQETKLCFDGLKIKRLFSSKF